MRLPRVSLAIPRDRWLDLGLCWGLGLGYLLVLLLTSHSLGYSRDEGFYFQAARTYGQWFDILLSEPSEAFKRATVDRYWSANHEHPALIKSLFWASHEYLHKLPLIGTHGAAYRFPAMALSAICVSVLYAWGRRMGEGQLGSVNDGRVMGLVGALSFAFLPQIFYHAHLACFDMPVTAMWVITTYAYWRSTRHSCWGWVLATGVLYGLLLNTKHNSWILPGALFLHLLLDRLLGLRAVKLTRLGIPASWFAAMTIAPAVFFATWPWIWFNTYKRLVEYVRFHTGHVYYNMEFLGQTYFEPPMPRLYAWLMTWATVPTVTLALFVLGAFVAWHVGLWPALRWRLQTLRHGSTALAARIWKKVTLAPEAETLSSSDDERAGSSTLVLWLLCIVASYAPWFSNKAPIFGGTKHWITAYPFLCLIAGYGLVTLLRLTAELPIRAAIRRTADAAIGVLVVAVPMVIAFAAHPWGLAAYVPAVGGAPGAASLGLNRSFWGYTTASVAPYLNEHADTGAKVFVHDTAMQSWQVMAQDRMLRRDLRPWGSVHGSAWAVYHHEQHMSRVEFMVWTDYRTNTPAQIGDYDGVPIVWLYQRPAKAKASRQVEAPSDDVEVQAPAEPTQEQP